MSAMRLLREKKIKAWTRAKRVALIESKNPKWDDLTREWRQAETFIHAEGSVN